MTNVINTGWVSTLMGLDQGSAVGVPGATAAPGPTAKETTAAPSTSQALPAQPVGPGGFNLMIPMIVMMVLLLGFTFWQNRKQGKQREELIKSVKKGDRVAMTSGIIGNIVEMTDDEIVIQVDQGRIRFNRSSLAGVLKSSRELPDSKVEVKQSTVSV